MLIDWFTVLAQLLNFVLLVWLLKRFLYRPVLEAIAARERLVAGQLAEAALAKSEAASERARFRDERETLDREREAILERATEEARVERLRLLDESRLAATALEEKRAEALREERIELERSLAGRIRREVFALARKALDDLASEDLEARLVAVFLERLRALDPEAKRVLGEALAQGRGEALVRSTLELPTGERAKIEARLRELFQLPVELRFETAPELGAGLELLVNGRRLAWCFDDYLDAFALELEGGPGEESRARGA